MEIKTKIKIIMFVLIMGLFVNPVSCDSGVFEWAGLDSNSYDTSASAIDSGSVLWLNQIYIDDAGASRYLDYVMVRSYMHPTNMYIPDAQSYWVPVTYKIGAVIVGTGTFGYLKNDDDTVTIAAFMNDDYDTSDFSGVQYVSIVGSLPNIRVNRPGTGKTYIKWAPGQDMAYLSYTTNRVFDSGSGSMLFTSKSSYLFTNEYNYNIINNLLYFNLSRGSVNKLKVKIDNQYENIINETVLDDEDLIIYDEDLINDTWTIYATNIFDNSNTHVISFSVPTYEPTLTTDKTYYNTSEQITISYTNIDKLYENNKEKHLYQKPYEVYILYPVIDSYKQYEAKYRQYLTYNLEDETFTLNTSFLSPQNTYVLGIVGTNGYYGLHDDILIFSDSFVVYPDDEYLSVSCDSESECYTYNNADITIYYKINNNSDIIIKDNNGNIINQYHNIIDEGEIIYHIPGDINHINTYPNWKIYLNNTEYSTSFNKGVTVYWSLFATPTPTPTYTPTPTPDINVSEQIDELKTEIEPIKDLLFGLSEIIIDNPDYDNDNIIDENEINHWFNSLIPICILFLLAVLYIGMRKKRE